MINFQGNQTLRISHKLGPCSQTISVIPSLCQSYIEQIPKFEHNYVEFVPQQKISYIPLEKEYQDIVEIQHDIDYIPVPRIEKYIELQIPQQIIFRHLPIEKYQTYYDYISQEICYIQSPYCSYNTSHYNPITNKNYEQRVPYNSFRRFAYQY